MNNLSRLIPLALAVLMVGCEQAPRSAARPVATQSVDELRAVGDDRLASRDWKGAAEIYRRGLAMRPDSPPFRYGLAIALSHLDRTDEAAQAFTWIVEHGSPDDDSVRVARAWLASVVPSPGGPVSERAASGDPSGSGVVRGRTEWSSLAPGMTAGLQILLEGDDGNRGRRYWARTRLNEPYEISGVVPGHYRLKAQVGPIRLWETSVDITPERPAIVDLTSATAIAPADALRP